MGLAILLGSLAPRANMALIRGDEDESTPSALGSAKEERLRALQEAREARNNIWEEAKKKREAAREELKLKLEDLKDQRKAKVVEHIGDRINALNEKWINHFNKVLARLNQILAKVKTRAEELASGGTDTSGVGTQITQAETAIAEAQYAVNNQAAQVYDLEPSDETTLGKEVSGVIGDFKDDIKAVWEKVRDARHQVVEAFSALKKATGEPEGTEGQDEEGASPTVSPTETPTPTITPI